MNSKQVDVQARLRASLCRRGLLEGRDFFLREADAGTRYVLLDLTEKEMITESLLLDCSAAHVNDWGVLVGAFEPGLDDLRAMVEVSGGGFTYISGGDVVEQIVSRAFRSALARAQPSA